MERHNLTTAMKGLKYFQLQLKDCVMETSCRQEGWPTSIGDPITVTRVRVEIF